MQNMCRILDELTRPLKEAQRQNIEPTQIALPPETSSGIAYIVLVYTLFVFQHVMEQKGVLERGKRSRLF